MAKQTARGKAQDKRKTAKRVLDDTPKNRATWNKNPGKMDLFNVDTAKGVKASAIHVSKTTEKKIDKANKFLKTAKYDVVLKVVKNNKTIKSGFKDMFSARNYITDNFSKKLRPGYYTNPFKEGYSVEVVSKKLSKKDADKLKSILE